VAAAVEEVLAHRAAGVGSEVLERSRRRGGRGDDDGVLHRAVLLELLHDLHDRRRLLADGDVHADLALALLVDDRVDDDGRLARLAVADDELALAAADGDHRVDGLDARLQRLLDPLALDHAGGLELDRAELLGLDGALVVERAAERVDDAADQGLAHRHLQHAPGALDEVALLDEGVLAEEHGADVVFFEVEGQADDVVRELEHLHGQAVAQAVDTSDPVADLEDGPDLFDLDLGLVVLDLGFEDRGDLFGSQLH